MSELPQIDAAERLQLSFNLVNLCLLLCFPGHYLLRDSLGLLFKS